MNFISYQHDYGIAPIISINKNGDVKIGNEIFNSIWHSVPGSARDLLVGNGQMKGSVSI